MDYRVKWSSGKQRRQSVAFLSRVYEKTCETGGWGIFVLLQQSVSKERRVLEVDEAPGRQG